jgi:subtilisin family serine protease
VRWTAALLATAALMGGCLEAAQPAWALQATQLDAVRSRSDGGWVRVALLDTGIDLGLPALRHLDDGNLFDGELIAYNDFLTSDDTPRDPDGHGSFVAGVLAGRPASGLAAVARPTHGVEGLAPGVHLIVGRMCDGDGHCSLFALLPALRWAVEQGADVIGLSLGFEQAEVAAAPEYVAKVRAFLAQAADKGVLVVAAAGNGGPGSLLFPADDPNVLAVGAIGTDLRARASSAWGTGGKPELAAPGEAIVGPGPDGVQRRDGTSAAVPFVVATSALLLQGFGAPDGRQDLRFLRDAMERTAKPLEGQLLPQDPQVGRGLLQAQAAWDAYALR